ncbi:MAG: LysE family transporter [Bacteroidales bacterium]|nr:LysE family transporter [Bacteroidales bacterium]
MLVELLKALLIGIIASAPPGPVSLLVMQKTFCHGRKAGFAAGIGSAVIDTLYAVASLFALMFIGDFFNTNEAWIMIVGGLMVVGVGLSMFLRKPLTAIMVADTSSAKAVQYALQAAGCALANPGALAYMFALVALFHLDVGDAVSPMWLIVVLVFAGALIWWFSFAYAADKMRSNFKVKTLNRVNKCAGLVVIGFGIVLIVRGIIML